MKPTSNNHEEELKKAERIAYLIAGHIRESLSEEESNELDDWISESDENLELFERLTDEDNIEAGIQQYLDIERRKAGAYQKIKQGIATEERKRRRKYWPYLAAACVLVVAASIYLRGITENKEGDEKAFVQGNTKDINPGKEKAVLVLADGRTVILDEESEGVLDNNDGAKVTKQDGGGLSYTSSDAVLTFHTLSTPRGGKYSVQLPDGTKVWLNAESSLRYPTSFNNSKSREVELRGEGYFEVAKDAAHPFRVKIDDKGGLEVLGTEFNVNAYAEARVVLVEGRVRVEGETGVGKSGSPEGGRRESEVGSRKSGSRGGENGQWAIGNGQEGNEKWVEMRPGEMAEIGENGEVKVGKGDVEEAVAWKEGKFLFRNADIRSIGEQIKRWYDVEVQYAGTIKQHFNTEMRRDLPLTKLLDGLEGTMQVHFELKGRTLTIKP